MSLKRCCGLWECRAATSARHTSGKSAILIPASHWAICSPRACRLASQPGPKATPCRSSATCMAAWPKPASRLKAYFGNTPIWLDSTLDRVGDAAVFVGIALWFAGDGNDGLLLVLSLYCLSSGAVVSYAKARAEGLGMTANVGVTERADRLVIVLVATGLDGIGVPYVQALALWYVAVGSTITIAQRTATVRRQSRAGASPERPS